MLQSGGRGSCLYRDGCLSFFLHGFEASVEPVREYGISDSVLGFHRSLDYSVVHQSGQCLGYVEDGFSHLSGYLAGLDAACNSKSHHEPDFS